MSKKHEVSLLAFRRGLNPTHFALYGAHSSDPSKLRPLSVREEPLRGLNATHKSKEKNTEAVLQVVESAELAPSEDTLVIKGAVSFSNAEKIEACNSTTFPAQHAEFLKRAKAEGDFTELAKRFAFQIASGAWGWRNADQATAVVVEVKAGSQVFNFKDLMFDLTKGFEPSAYPDAKDSLKQLSEVIEAALTAEKGARATRIDVTGYFHIGPSARVYPSQEWPSAHAQSESKKKWPGGKGITRVLAKLEFNGENHAIINDRKVGNALRTVDTWYSNEPLVVPIAVEPYGGNSHKSVALRNSSDLSVFGILNKLHADVASLTRNERLYYLASVLRGGVYGSKSE